MCKEHALPMRVCPNHRAIRTCHKHGLAICKVTLKKQTEDRDIEFNVCVYQFVSSTADVSLPAWQCKKNACCSVLQCAAGCYSVLQCAAVCCSVLQCAAVR